jgi:hypothetical protein
MEQELKPRQQVNLCMSVYFYSCNFASLKGRACTLLGFDPGVSQTTYLRQRVENYEKRAMQGTAASQNRLLLNVSYLTIVMVLRQFSSDLCKYRTKKQRLLKAKIAVALQDEFGRVPIEEEIDHVFHLTRAMWKAVSGLHYKRKEQKKSRQLAVF